ncbi:MAG: hypothetical protein MUF38_19075 [Anaerolineae bacterium]|jgi:hypothetical protein|nr:hypothetical protein [Anaerolineae bacterium]
MTPRTTLTLLIAFLTFAARPSSAQEPTPFPTFPPVPTVAIPENPIITAITGIVYAGTTDGYVTFNPGTGEITPMPEELQGIGGILSPDGTLWAQWTASGAQQPVNTTQIMDLAQNEVRVVYQPDGTRDPNRYERRQVVNWSADSLQVMYSAIINQVGVYPPGTNGSLQYNFEIVDAMSGQRTTILEIPPMTLLNDIFPSPIAREGVILDFIHYNYWNPVYTEWIFVQPSGYGKDASGQYIGGLDAGIYNWATRQYISFATLFPQTVISGTGWSADGSMMALNTMTGISVIHFSLDENGAPASD